MLYKGVKKNSNEYVVGYYVPINEKVDIIYEYGSYIPFQMEKGTVSKVSTRSDINGTLICENDILETKAGEKVKVEWSEYFMTFVVQVGFKKKMLYEYMRDNVAWVVGTEYKMMEGRE